MCKKIDRHPNNPNIIVAIYPDGGMRYATAKEIEEWELEQKTLVDKDDYKPSEDELELLTEMESGIKPQPKKGKKKDVSVLPVS